MKNEFFSVDFCGVLTVKVYVQANHVTSKKRRSTFFLHLSDLPVSFFSYILCKPNAKMYSKKGEKQERLTACYFKKN